MTIQRKNILPYTLESSELKNTPALQQCNGIKACSNLSDTLLARGKQNWKTRS